MHFLPIGSTQEREEIGTASFTPSQEEYDLFYRTFGECFSVWSELESRLLCIYVFLLHSPEYNAASASFYSTTGFRAKLELVDAVVQESQDVSSADLGVWSKLYEKISKKSKSRNQIAHQTVFYGKVKDKQVKKMFVAHPRTPTEGAQLYLNELVQIRDSFLVVSDELFLFWQGLVEKRNAKL